MVGQRPLKPSIYVRVVVPEFEIMSVLSACGGVGANTFPSPNVPEFTFLRAL